MLTPTVRRTLAPRGQTPIVPAWDRHDRISAISAITISPKRKRRGLYFRLLPDNRNVRSEDVVDFLRHLRRHQPGPLSIIWDRSNTHDRSKQVRAYLAKHPEIRTYRFPGYAPDLNPDEFVWSHLKYGRLCNFAAADTTELRGRLLREFDRLRSNPDLLGACIQGAKLPIRINRMQPLLSRTQ